MGACVSVRGNPDSNMKYPLSFGSKTENLVISSPIKDKPLVNGDAPIAEGVVKSQWSTSHPATTVRDFASKEETFFDSQPWLESDCDEDFMSVNGDFTPSRDSTPVHHSFSAGAPRLTKAHFDDKTPYSKPPRPPKKRLSELFRDSFDESNKEVDDHNVTGSQNGVNGKIEPKKTVLGLPSRSANSTPFASGANSVCSSDRTPNNGDYRFEKEKPMKSTQCCLPRMLSSRSFSGRKKTSPARSIG